MEVSLDCAIEGPRAKFCDFITVLIPVAALGVFLFARTYLEFDKYAVSAFAYFYFSAVSEGVDVHCLLVD